jgi:hypothetical protein
VVGGLRSDFAGFHHFVSGNGNGVFESVDVPSLKEGEVQTDVRWVEGCFMGDLYKEACEVFDVVHFLLSVFGYRLSVFCSRFSVIGYQLLVVSFLFSVNGSWFLVLGSMILITVSFSFGLITHGFIFYWNS